MNGFVKLRRGLAEHVGTGRMTLTEHGAYTLLLQLADHTTGRWRGTQRSFAAAAGISSGMAWKILTSLEQKGYLSWNRERRSVQISKFFVEKPVEIERQSPAPGRPIDQVGHAHDRLIRNTRTPLEKRDVAPSDAAHAPAPPTRTIETPKPDPAVMVAILSAMRQVAFTKSIGDEIRSRRAASPRSFLAPSAARRAGDRSPP